MHLTLPCAAELAMFGALGAPLSAGGGSTPAPQLPDPPLAALFAGGADGAHWRLEDFAWDAHQMLASPADGAGGGRIGRAQALLAPSPAPKKKGQAAPNAAPKGKPAAIPCCVPGCKVRIAPQHQRRFNKRARACDAHVGAEAVRLDASSNVLSRFCQKHYVWHPLSDFEGSRHTCRDALNQQNERRRAKYAARSSAGDDEDADADADEDDGGGSGASRGVQSAAAAEIDSAVHGSAAIAAVQSSWLSWLRVEADAAAAAAARAQAAADAAVRTLRVCAATAGAAAAAADDDASLQLKFHDALPGHFPPAIRAAVGAAFPRAAVAATAEGWIEPGCTLLRVEPTLLPLMPREQADAAGVARALLRGEAGDWFATQRFDLCCGGGAARHVPGAGVTPLPRPQQLQRLPVPSTRALCTSASARCRLALADGAALPRVRFHGSFLKAAVTHCGAIGDCCVIELPACGLEGVALIEAAPRQLGELAIAQPARAVLLTPNADVAAEVASLHDDDDSASEALLRALGAALRPRCPRHLAAAACAEAACRGWSATTERIATLLRDSIQEDDDAADVDNSASLLAPQGHATLLHFAAASGSAATVAALLRAGGVAFLFGAPDEADDAGTTPLHIAAAQRGAAVAVDALRAAGGAAAERAWRDGADVAGSLPAATAAADATALARADAESFAVARAEAALPQARLAALMSCVISAVLATRGALDSLQDIDQHTAAAALSANADWAALRPLLRGRRYLLRLPITAVLCAYLFAPRLRNAYRRHSAALFCICATYFFVGEGLLSALTANAVVQRARTAARLPPAAIRWPWQVGLYQLALTAAIGAASLPPVPLCVLVAARVLLLPLAAEMMGFPVWHLLADVRWHVAHVALGVALCRAQLARHRAARVAWCAQSAAGKKGA